MRLNKLQELCSQLQIHWQVAGEGRQETGGGWGRLGRSRRTCVPLSSAKQLSVSG